MTCAKEFIRAEGGIVHSDGNVFFTSVAQFEEAASKFVAWEHMVWCDCGDGFKQDSWDAGFLAAKGRCPNCDMWAGNSRKAEGVNA